jgi:hypothetical protein
VEVTGRSAAASHEEAIAIVTDPRWQQ